jgi:hypothetical protein
LLSLEVLAAEKILVLVRVVAVVLVATVLR